MHRMTRDAASADIRAPFDGTRWRFKDDQVVLEARASDRFVRIESASEPAQTFRVTRVVGGRTREDFVGVDVNGGSEELVLPVSFLLTPRTLRYKGYSVMVHERPSLRAGPVWRQTCIFCHNTVPEMDRLLAVFAAGPPPRYQGQNVERWLPAERQARFSLGNLETYRDAVEGEVARLGGQPLRTADSQGRLTRAAIEVVRTRFGAPSLVEVGIGCEACHGGGREHLRNPAVHPSWLPTAPWLDVTLPAARPGVASVAATPPEAARALAENRVCARCHQVLFSRYPYTWEGGRRDAGAGGSHINSGEARDFLLGACADAMRCTTCHDPHGGHDPAAVRSTPSALDSTCTACHASFRDPEASRAHSHHDPRSAGGACVSCHMPRKNMGLEGTLTRYHRIGSPTDPERVLGDRPLECALCHAGRTVANLVDTMERWWPVRYPRQRLKELYGSLDADVLRATLELGKPHERVVAVAALGEAGARDAAPLVARELLDEYPLLREWARRSLQKTLGRCEVDLAADDAAIARQAQSCVGAAAVPTAPVHGPARADPGDEEPED